MSTSRRDALATIGAIAMTATSFTSVQAQTESGATLRVAVIPIFDCAALYAALAQGYFTAEKLTVTTSDVGAGGAAMIPALIGGAYDIAFANSPSVALAIERGVNLRLLLSSPGVSGPPPATVALLKRAGDPISTGKDLEGKFLATNALGNIQWMVARSWIKATGGDPDKVRYVEIPVPAMTEAIKQGRAATAMVIDPFLTVALEQPETFAVLSWPFNVVYNGGPITYYVCTDDLIHTKAALIQAFVRAFRRGVTWVNENRGKDPLTQLIASYTHMQPDLIRKIPMEEASGNIDPTRFTMLLDLMRDNRLLTKDVDLASHVYKVT